MKQQSLMSLLDWIYARAADGLAGVESAQQLASRYEQRAGSLEERVDALIRWQCAKCGGVGLVTGLGGVLTLPVALPANLSSVLYLQTRLAAAIACLGGEDLRDERVKTLILLCLCGSAATELAKELGLKMGRYAAQRALHRLSAQLAARAQQRIGAALARKIGGRGIAALGRGVPLAGAAFGGAVDALATYAVGEVAKRAFIK